MAKKIILKEGSNLVGFPPVGYKFLGLDDEILSLNTEGIISPVGGGVLDTNAIQLTYSELLSLKETSSLEIGSWYLITDYNSTNFLHGIKGTVYGYNSSHQSPTEPLLVRAVSVNEISGRAYSTVHPNDIIYYSLDEYNTICENSTFTTGTGEDNISVGFDSGKLYVNLPINYLYVGTTENNLTINLTFTSGDNIDIKFTNTELTTNPSTPNEDDGSLNSTCSLFVLPDGSHRVYFDNITTSYTLDSGQIQQIGYLGKEFKGSITRRVDPLYNVDMGIDWRNVKYKRYESTINSSEIPIGFTNTIWSPLPISRLPLEFDTYDTTPTGNSVELYITGVSNDVGISIGAKGQVNIIRDIVIKSLDNVVLIKDDSEDMNQKNVLINYGEMLTIGGESFNYTINVCESIAGNIFNYIGVIRKSNITSLQSSTIEDIQNSDLTQIDRCLLVTLESCTAHNWAGFTADTMRNTTIRTASNSTMRNVISSTINYIVSSDLTVAADTPFGSGNSTINYCDFDFISGMRLNFRRMEGCRGSYLQTVISFADIELPNLDIINVDFGETRNMTFTAGSMQEVTFRKTDGLRINANFKNVTFLGEYRNLRFQGGFQDIVFKGDFDSGSPSGPPGVDSSNNLGLALSSPYTNIDKEIIAKTSTTLVAKYLDPTNSLVVADVTIT